MSTYHMMVLLLFNEEGQAHTAKTLQLATGIPAADFKRTMQSLALVKVRSWPEMGSCFLWLSARVRCRI